ncbi:MAG TPA: hypothetical protein VKX16_11255 [Chloroflexota bacterium]|nr:hypothetical protein [Chloroflexota bacterium]
MGVDKWFAIAAVVVLVVAMIALFVANSRQRPRPRVLDEDADEVQEAIDRFDEMQTSRGRSQFWRF